MASFSPAVCRRCVVSCQDKTCRPSSFVFFVFGCRDPTTNVYPPPPRLLLLLLLFQEDKVRLRKERRAKLGEDLLSVSGDVPFKFPPTFTFVFRAFTSLDGIGKGLDTK